MSIPKKLMSHQKPGKSLKCGKKATRDRLLARLCMLGARHWTKQKYPRRGSKAVILATGTLERGSPVANAWFSGDSYVISSRNNFFFLNRTFASFNRCVRNVPKNFLYRREFGLHLRNYSTDDCTHVAPDRFRKLFAQVMNLFICSFTLVGTPTEVKKSWTT